MWKGLWIPIAKESCRIGLQEGRDEGRVMVFKNMIRRGFAEHNAMSLAGITEEQAKKALEEIGEKSPV